MVAAPVGFDPREPYVIVGAHLDTVPQAPGAEDNASGVSVLMELSRMAVVEPPATPTVFVAFGAEEPRGAGHDWHHFGSACLHRADVRVAAAESWWRWCRSTASVPCSAASDLRSWRH